MSDDFLYSDQEPSVKRSSPVNWLAAAVLALSIVVLALSYTTFYFAQESAVSFQETYENRAVECRIAIKVDVELRKDGPCYDKNVLRYYDPEAYSPIISEEQVERIGDLFCLILAQEGVTAEQCLTE